jgi:hypothetical protein
VHFSRAVNLTGLRSTDRLYKIGFVASSRFQGNFGRSSRRSKSNGENIKFFLLKFINLALSCANNGFAFNDGLWIVGDVLFG